MDSFFLQLYSVVSLQHRKVLMERSSPMTTVISVSETQARTGRQARLKTWFPARTVAALVSAFTLLYELYTVTVSGHVRSKTTCSPPSGLQFTLREIYVIFIHYQVDSFQKQYRFAKMAFSLSPECARLQ